VDRSDLLDGLLSAEGGRGACGERALGWADDVRRPEPASGAAKPRLPRSRDFR
jgi:error-prone DNA polymerase